MKTMEKTLGYIVFVSYNRDAYTEQGIDFKEMTLTDFIRFNETDEVNCKSVSVDAITESTRLHTRGSCIGDDSFYWFIAEKAVTCNDEYKAFINQNLIH